MAELTHINRTNENNLGGGKYIEIIPVEDVSVFPDAIDCQIINCIDLLPGKEWYKIEFTHGTQEFTEQTVEENGAEAFAQQLTGIIPKERADVFAVLKAMQHKRFLVNIRDQNGTEILMGTLNEGVKMNITDRTTGADVPDRNQYTITFQITRRDPAYLYNVPWEEKILCDYIARNPHASYSQAVIDELTARLAPGTYIYNTFGPEGQNRTTANFILLFEIVTSTNAGTTVKTGSTLRWDADGTIYNQNGFPAHTLTGAGIVTVTSTDGFDAITSLRLVSIGIENYFPSIESDLLAELDYGNNAIIGAEAEHITPAMVTYRNYQNTHTGNVKNYNWPSLTTYHIHQNSFSGSVPTFEYCLNSIYSILLNNNSFSTIINWAFGSQFGGVHMGFNSFASTMPDFGTNGDWSGAVELRAQSCGWTGTLPSLSNLTALTELFLQTNSFHGATPDFSATAIEDLYLNDNDLDTYADGTVNAEREIHRIDGNDWDAASVNNYLADAVAVDPTGPPAARQINLSGGTMAAPTGQGITDKNTLIANGHTVTIN